MISVKFLWGNVFFWRKATNRCKNSNFEFFESALCMKSVSMLNDFTQKKNLKENWVKSLGQFKANVYKEIICIMQAYHNIFKQGGEGQITEKKEKKLHAENV